MDSTVRVEKFRRLALMRRLYHHVVNGGTLRQQDHDLCGFTATAESLSAEIARLEGEIAAAESAPN